MEKICHEELLLVSGGAFTCLLSNILISVISLVGVIKTIKRRFS